MKGKDVEIVPLAEMNGRIISKAYPLPLLVSKETLERMLRNYLKNISMRFKIKKF